MREILLTIRKELMARLVRSWRSTVVGVAALLVTVMLHYRCMTMEQVLELFGFYHAIKMAFKKELENKI